jgi:ParB-like chromosome segregation protein Spo0J
MKMEAYYEIIAGHRRYEACKKIGWKKSFAI